MRIHWEAPGSPLPIRQGLRDPHFARCRRKADRSIPASRYNSEQLSGGPGPASDPYPCGELLALGLVQVPVPVMALGESAYRFVVLECVQKFTFGPLGCPFLLADRTVHGKSDEHFCHGTLLEHSVPRHSQGIAGWGSSVHILIR